jgi:hypothetical protein
MSGHFLEGEAMSEGTQFEILAGSSALIFAAVVLWLTQERRIRVNSLKSAFIHNTSAWSSLAKKIGTLLQPGDEVLVPAGRGRYPFKLGRKHRENWERQVQEWTDRRVRLTPIIIAPDHEALALWQNLVDRLSSTFRVCVLNPDLASSEDRKQISRLETFHPVLILRDNKPLCMWVENYHPANTAVANNVQYVAPEDMNDIEITRFNRYLKVLRRLTDATRQPPHLRELRPSDKAGSTPVKFSANAA